MAQPAFSVVGVPAGAGFSRLMKPFEKHMVILPPLWREFTKHPPIGNLICSFWKWPNSAKLLVNLSEKAKIPTADHVVGKPLVPPAVMAPKCSPLPAVSAWGFPIQTCTNTVPGSGAPWPQFSCCFDTPFSIIYSGECMGTCDIWYCHICTHALIHDNKDGKSQSYVL